MRAKWRLLGLELGHTPGRLSAIAQRYQGSLLRLRGVLVRWLKTGAATRGQLARALRSVHVGEEKLAKKLERRYCWEGQLLVKTLSLCIIKYIRLIICHTTWNTILFPYLNLYKVAIAGKLLYSNRAKLLLPGTWYKFIDNLRLH